MRKALQGSRQRITPAVICQWHRRVVVVLLCGITLLLLWGRKRGRTDTHRNTSPRHTHQNNLRIIIGMGQCTVL